VPYQFLFLLLIIEYKENEKKAAGKIRNAGKEISSFSSQSANMQQQKSGKKSFKNSFYFM
jgi:hypothetical protein